MHERPFLDEEYKWMGYWWLPENQDDKVPGILTYKPDEGIKLSLIGGFDIFENTEYENGGIAFSGKYKNPEVIYGICNGNKITILENRLTGESSPAIGLINGKTSIRIVDQKFKSEYILEGTHLDKNSSVFHECLFSLENMSTWAPANNITWIKDPNDNSSRTIRIDKFKELRKNINNIRYTLDYDQITSFSKNYKGYINFCNTSYPNISIQFDKCMGLDEIENRIRSFQNLLSLASYGTPGLLWAILYSHDTDHKEQTVNLYKKYRSVPNKDGEVDLNNFLFTCLDIPFDLLVERWLELSEKIYSPLILLVSTLYKDQYLESDLTLIATAAESLHNSLYSKKIEEKFNEIREEIVEVVPKGYRERFNGMLHNRFTLRLRDRLKELAMCLGDSALSPEITKLLIPDIETWAKETTKMRNTIAHRGATKEQDYGVMYAALQVTKSLLILIILAELGLPNKKLEDIVNNHPKIRRAADLAKEYLTKDDSSS